VKAEAREPLRWCAAAVLGLTVVAVPLVLSAAHPGAKSLTLAVGASVVLCLAAPAWILRRGDPLPARLLLPAAAFLVANLLSIARAVRPDEGLRALYVWAVLLGLYGATATLVESRRAARRLAGTMVAVGCVVATVAAVQFFDPSSFAGWQAGGQALGTLGNPNYVGGYLAGLALLCLGLWWEAETAPGRVLSAGALGLLVLGLAVTRARGGWLAFLVGAIVFAGSMGSRRAIQPAPAWTRVGAVVALFAGLGVVGFWFREIGFLSYAATVLDPTYPTNAARMSWWMGTLALAAAHPLLGVGMGNFPGAFVPYNSAPSQHANQIVMVEHPHNEYLGIVAEGGLLGLGAFTWLLWRAQAIAREALEAPRGRGPFAAGLVAMLVAGLVHSLFFFVLREPAGAMNLWVAAALLEVVARRPPAPGRTEGRPARTRAGIAAGATAVLAAIACYLLAVRPALAASAVQQAKRAVAAGQPASAEAHLQRALAWHPRSADAAFELGSALAAGGRRAEAERAFARAARANPGYLSAANNRAVILAELGRRGEAIAALRSTLALNPRYASGQNNLGRLLLDERQATEAIRHLERATAAYPAFPTARHNLAIAYAKVGRLAEAEGQLTAALALAPRNALYWLDLAVVRTAEGRREGALEALRRAVTLEPRLRAPIQSDPRLQALAGEAGFALLLRPDGPPPR
jgi:O-antigen ligase/Flp pilus assembly protein TadD